MKHAVLVMVGFLLIAACLSATPVFAQTPTPAEALATGSTVAPGSTPTPAPTPAPVGIQALVSGLADPFLYLVLLITLVAGGLGGLIYDLITLQGNWERPHQLTEEEVTEASTYARTAYMYDLGSWARVIVGGLAAVAVFLVFSPSSVLELVAAALIAGSAGTAIFKSLQDRLTSVLALKEAAETRAAAAEMAGKVEEAAAALETAAVVTPSGANGQSGVQSVPEANTQAVQEAQRLLAEARALSEVIRK